MEGGWQQFSDFGFVLLLKATVFTFSTQFYTDKIKIFFLSKTNVVILKGEILE
jgi:hypothetical protein